LAKAGSGAVAEAFAAAPGGTGGTTRCLASGTVCLGDSGIRGSAGGRGSHVII